MANSSFTLEHFENFFSTEYLLSVDTERVDAEGWPYLVRTLVCDWVEHPWGLTLPLSVASCFFQIVWLVMCPRCSQTELPSLAFLLFSPPLNPFSAAPLLWILLSIKVPDVCRVVPRPLAASPPFLCSILSQSYFSASFLSTELHIGLFPPHPPPSLQRAPRSSTDPWTLQGLLWGHALCLGRSSYRVGKPSRWHEMHGTVPKVALLGPWSSRCPNPSSNEPCAFLIPSLSKFWRPPFSSPFWAFSTLVSCFQNLGLLYNMVSALRHCQGLASPLTAWHCFIELFCFCFLILLLGKTFKTSPSYNSAFCPWLHTLCWYSKLGLPGRFEIQSKDELFTT